MGVSSCEQVNAITPMGCSWLGGGKVEYAKPTVLMRGSRRLGNSRAISFSRAATTSEIHACHLPSNTVKGVGSAQLLSLFTDGCFGFLAP